MRREYYSDPIDSFVRTGENEIIGRLALSSGSADEPTQKDAWLEQIRILKRILAPHQGSIYFEYSIPRMGRRIDVLLLIGPVIFILEFKVGEDEYPAYAIDQVWDYALDLKNFHDASHNQFIAPILISTKAPPHHQTIVATPQNDKLLLPIRTNVESLSTVINDVLTFADGAHIDRSQWDMGRYCPTPTIIEAAMALYAGHSVTDISRSDAGAINLTQTSDAISRIISDSKKRSRKSICFLTGVPGAGKTLVGLNIATKHFDKKNDLYSVFLSGNGPLVAILREALTRDRVRNERARGKKITKGVAMSAVKTFIQNVHNFRDDCLADGSRPPVEHVALFDEAQRAWDLQQTSNFMRRKKGKANFNQSEPEFLISCLDRHTDWAVIVCLVGGGQEINVGESGITEWIESLNRSYKDWDIHISSHLFDSEYSAGKALESLKARKNVAYKDELHLAVSMRSFRAENVSKLVKQVLDLEVDEARQTLAQVSSKYPIAITRDLFKAKRWLRERARGSERYGILASSQAYRLKPHAIDVRATSDPIHWFLDGKEDTRSSYYLEDVATEFDVQGLELDWACVTWDADFRFTQRGWEHKSFVGSKWNKILNVDRQTYLKNAYRVLLTRARQGMVIVIPEGVSDDPTRLPEFYDPTFSFLKEVGFRVI
ncbi:MAG TPA: DUF2075 domain-containing protein [Elusimicrobiota bacterium]|nr:DUF2075 domain-containing protein [Elusimicrobiota bacterium]